MKVNTLKISALLLAFVVGSNLFAQVGRYLYPYAEGVVYDNNGHDLTGFAKSNKKETAYKGGKIDEFSGGSWGYLQVTNARVPSINVLPGKDKKAIYSYSDYIDATVALFSTKDGIKGTWWARQCNNPQGPLFYKKVDDEGNLDIPNVRYTDFTREMETKKFTIVEYNDTIYNQRDYDQLLKNYIIIENGLIKDVNDYRTIIDFYNNFLTRFTYVDDPLLENKSFVTFFTAGNNKYVGFFNIVKGKLGGHLQRADIQFEQDKDPFVAYVMKKLTGKVIYIYGDDIFGLEKTFLKYKHSHHDLTFFRRKTDATEKFNKEN
jgi:hypothetical protein